MTDVVVTGAAGRIGTAIVDYLSDEYQLTLLDRTLDEEMAEGIEVDIRDQSAVTETVDGHDAMVHLAGEPQLDAPWESILENNIVGTYNCLEAARKGAVETVVFASSNHVVGMYERDHAPELYSPDYDLVVDHTGPVRPDSFYATSKVFGEALGRQYVETRDWPVRFYGLRIGSVRSPSYDHPYGDAEKGVAEGRFSRDSPEYEAAVDRMKATWLSRRDMTQLVDCCLRQVTPSFEIFYGVSDNAGRWFDLEHARDAIGFQPNDSADAFDSPPSV